VIENHLFQIVALLAMEPPATRSFADVQAAKAAVMRAARPLAPGDLVRGQYAGYRDEKGVAKDSDVETYCALRLQLDNARWRGVPWFLRAGKALPVTAVEVVVRLKPPAQALFEDSERAAAHPNHLRFRLQPSESIALAARVKSPGKHLVGHRHELTMCEDTRGEEPAYARLLGDAMAGDGSLFTSSEAVVAAWTIVEPVLDDHPAALVYPRGSWGPGAADALAAGSGGWADPLPEDPCPPENRDEKE
jgi:glucose-6-phosphate 1-dehydrogenase